MVAKVKVEKFLLVVAFCAIAISPSGCSESVVPEDPPKVTFILSDSTVMRATFSFLTSAPTGDCFRVNYRL